MTALNLENKMQKIEVSYVRMRQRRVNVNSLLVVQVSMNGGGKRTKDTSNASGISPFASFSCPLFKRAPLAIYAQPQPTH